MQSVQYCVVCVDPDDPETEFECILPRSEVQADLLEAFEKSSLPEPGDHGNKKVKPAWIKACQDGPIAPCEGPLGAPAWGL